MGSENQPMGAIGGGHGPPYEGTFWSVVGSTGFGVAGCSAAAFFASFAAFFCFFASSRCRFSNE
jgi:hypothetical protein